MKKFLKKIKRNRKWIIKFSFIFILIIMVVSVINTSYGVVNPEFYKGESELEDKIGSIISQMAQTGAGVLGKPISLIVNLVSFILFAVMYVVFVGSGIANGLTFPFPDQIVFNGLSMLDPNFINPTGDSGAIINMMQGVIQNIYFSFFTLAGTVFVLAAVIIGIKLAFSALASEKAQYKEAIKHYVVGLAVLFLIHFVLAGMFALNEKICIEAYKICKNVTISVNRFDLVPEVGSTIKGLINSVGTMFGNPNAADVANVDIPVPGYGGIILKFAINGIIQGDLIYSIGLLIILGQTFSLIIMYIKRLFYCIILGMIAPLIVAMDTIQKVVTGKDTGILKNWFQNLVAIIFNQSFQAIFMCIVILVIGQINSLSGSGNTNTDLVEALVAIVALHSIMKFDKLFKELLGIKDSKIMGGINENAMRSFAAIKSGLALAKRSAEPFQKRAQAKLRYSEAAKRRDKALANLANLNSGSSGSPNTSSGEFSLGSNSSQQSGNGGNNANSNNNMGTQQLVDAINRLGNSLDQNTRAQSSGATSNLADKKQKLEEELASAEADMKKARADQRAESLRAFTRFGTSVGSVAFGVGATDNFGDAVTVGNIIDMPMDKLTDRQVDRSVYGNTSRKLANRENDLVDKYVSSGIGRADAEKLAKQSIANIQSQLNSAIPENIGSMVSDITKEALKGTADVVSKQGRKYAKKASKEIYKAGKIDDI